jgi:hypothetical protein
MRKPIETPRVKRIVERRYKRAEKKFTKANKKGPVAVQKVNKKYGYNVEEAQRAGMGVDSNGHMGSLNTQTGHVLKGPKHPSMILTRRTERSLGNKIIKRKGERYSVPKKKTK